MTNIDIEVALALSKRNEVKCRRLKKYLFDTNKKIYIIGRNDESIIFSGRFNVDGIIDDYNLTEEEWNGLPLPESVRDNPTHQ